MTQANVMPPPAPLPKKRRRWLTVLLAMMIFASGLVIGSSGAVIVVVRGLKYAAQHPEEAPRRIAHRLERKLGLSDDQVRKIESILQLRQTRLMAIRREVQPRVVEELDESYQDIAAVLDDQQRARWHTMYGELKRDWLPGAPASTGAATQM